MLYLHFETHTIHLVSHSTTELSITDCFAFILICKEQPLLADVPTGTTTAYAMQQYYVTL